MAKKVTKKKAPARKKSTRKANPIHEANLADIKKQRRLVKTLEHRLTGEQERVKSTKAEIARANVELIEMIEEADQGKLPLVGSAT